MISKQISSIARHLLSAALASVWMFGQTAGAATPVASNGSVTTPINAPVSITLRANDGDGDPLNYQLLTMPRHGTLAAGNASHVWRYTPNSNFVGIDTLTFQASDGRTVSNPGRFVFSVEDGNIVRYQVPPDIDVNGGSHIYGPYVADAVAGAGRVSNFPHIQPGDRIEITPGMRTSTLRIWGLSGTAERPIVIINKGGPVDFNGGGHSIEIDAGKYIQFVGVGEDSIDRGIHIRNGSTKGIRLGESYAHDIEIGFTEIDHTKIGISFGTKYPAGAPPVARNIHVHNNYVHNITDEGMYLGKSRDQDAGAFSTTEGLVVEYNTLENIGYEAIQIRGNRGPDNVVHHNRIVNAGMNRDGGPNDMHAIYGNDVHQVRVYNNFIQGSARAGIYLREAEATNDSEYRVYNNIVIDSGLAGIDKGHGILIVSGHKAFVTDNVIVNAREYGITYYNGLASALISNNLIVNVADRIAAVRKTGNSAIVRSGNRYVDNVADLNSLDPVSLMVE